MPVALEIHGLRKCYHAGIPGCSATVDALRDVELVVSRGELIEVVGPAGSGKSTLLLCAAGLLEPDAGRIVWFGRPPAGRPPDHVAYAAATATPGESSTVGELLASTAGRGRSSRGGAGRAVAEALRRTGLGGAAGTRVVDLGGGARRRLLLARSLLGRPDLLLLDEPLAGLDEPEQGEVAGCLRRLARGGMAIVLASRGPGAAGRLGARVVALQGGRARAPLPPLTGAQRVRVAEDAPRRAGARGRRSVDPPSLHL